MPPKKTIKLTIGTRRGQRVILVGFDHPEMINAKVSEFGVAQWIPEQGNWYIPEEQFDLHSFFDAFKGEAFIDYSGLRSHAPVRTMKAETRSSKRFFVPVKALSKMLRAILIRKLKEQIGASRLKLTEAFPGFDSLKKELYQKDWNVYAKKALGGVSSVLSYLGR